MQETNHLLDESHHINKWIEKIYHLADFNIKPEETVYIGDSISDGVSAKGAGLHFIALLESGLRSREDLKSVPVDFFANTFPEITDYIN